MAEGMAEIQKLPLSAVKFILRNNIALHPHARFDDMLQLRMRRRAVQLLEKRRVSKHRVFDDLRAAVAENFVRQGIQTVRVAEHEPRLIKRPGQIFPGGQIDGRLAADGGIDHGQQRRRDLDKPDPTQIGGGRKARQITHYAAAQRDDCVRPRQPVFTQRVEKRQIRLRALGALPMRKHKPAHGKTGVHKAFLHRFAIQRPYGIIRDKHDRACVRHAAHQFARAAQQPALDQNVVPP